MISLLSKNRNTPLPYITDDQYRDKVAKNAAHILNLLLDKFPDNFHQLSTLNILVIGSGFFPSFMPIVNILSQHLPGLHRLNFSLIEPMKSETDRFENYFNNLTTKDNHPKLELKYSIINSDIKHYLSNNQDTLFDIIYFEQPDLSPLSIILAKTINSHEKLNQSLRESVPYLKYIIRNHSMIVASCLFTRDLKQLNTLINFSLYLPTRLAYLPGLFNDGTPYHSGLVSIVDQSKLPKRKPETISFAIKKNDDFYFFFLAISLLMFIITPPIGKIPSGFFTIAICLYHRYGFRNVLLKLLLVTTQIFILVVIFYLG